jgi:hypothetical protein
MKNTKADGPLHRGKDQKYFPNKMRKRREWRREEKERGRMRMRGVSTGFDENLYFHYQCQVPWERSTMNLSMPSTKASKFASPNDSCHTSLAASNCQTAVAMCLKLPCRKEVVRPRTAGGFGLVGEEKRSRKCNVSRSSFSVSDHLSPKPPTWIHRRKRSTLVCFLGSALRDHLEKDLILDRFHSRIACQPPHTNCNKETG